MRYRALSAHLRARFGARVQRVVLRGGFSCPNRDGTKGRGGCTFCSAASMTSVHVAAAQVAEQLRQGVERMRRRYKAKAFLPYFNDFSATYAHPERLRALYDAALDHPEVVGLALGTRPDCLPPPVLDLLAEYAARTYLWVELGLQSASDATLERIRRGHSAADFAEASIRLAEAGIAVCAHVIHGLPGEGIAEFVETARFLARLPIAGVKIHNLHVLRGSALAHQWKQGRLRVPSLAEHAEAVAAFLAELPPELVIHRLVADAPADYLLAPDWCRRKNEALAFVRSHLEATDTWQGKALGAPLEAVSALLERLPWEARAFR